MGTIKEAYNMFSDEPIQRGQHYHTQMKKLRNKNSVRNCDYFEDFDELIHYNVDCGLNINDKVTISDGRWWEGDKVIHSIYKKGIKTSKETPIISFHQVRLGHSKTWEEVQSKFGSVWYS